MAKVLVVDDDVDLRETYTDVLEAAGHEVQCATSGTQALKTLTTFVPDVVTLDMQLPGGSGTLVLAYVRRHPHFAHTKVIIVSGFAQRARFAAKDWGADGCLTKPVSPEALRAVVTNALNNTLDVVAPNDALDDTLSGGR